MKKINILLGALLLSLTGCSNGPQADTSSIKVMCPKGAPSLAFYNKTNNLTTGGAADVKPELLKNDYDFVVFDFYNGLKLQKANEGHYKLARIVTANNFYLVGINHHELPTEGAKVTGFTENSLPSIAFNNLYSELNLTMDYVEDATGIPAVLKTGKCHGVDQDYVIAPEPSLTTVLSSVEDPSIYTVFSIKEAWQQVKGENEIIPQAGLFMNMDKYDSNKDAYDLFIKELDKDINDGIQDANKIKTGIESVGDVDTQKDIFQIPAAVAYNVQKNGKNGVGLVASYTKSLVSNFLNAVGKGSEDYSNYII